MKTRFQGLPGRGQTLPAVGQGCPAIGHGLPAIGQNLPELGQSRPARGQSRPGRGQRRPTVGQSLSTLGQSLPTVGHRLPTLGQTPPAPGQTPPTPRHASENAISQCEKARQTTTAMPIRGGPNTRTRFRRGAVNDSGQKWLAQSEEAEGDRGMNPAELSSLTRREWLERVSGPAVGGALGAAMLAAQSAQAQSALPPSRAIATSGGATGSEALLGARVYNVRDFGAKGDGLANDTAAVQAAIDACHRDNGGTVLVPAGDFVVGTLELKSNLTLHLATKGRLLGSPNQQDYRAGRGIPPGNGNIVLLGGAELENVTIEGNGTIDGNGLKFWTGQGDNTGPGQNSAQGYFQRPHLIVFHKCRNVRMRDVFLTASAYHCMRILSCEQVWFERVRIYNRVNKNNDGFHFNNCQYVHVTACDIKCQDDACALFGSNKWVTVSDCTFSTRWSIFRFGGGHCENITVTNCVIYDTFGSVVKMSARGTSRFENIAFSNLIMKNVTGPITIGLQSRRSGGANTNAANATGGGAEKGKEAQPAARGVVRNISFNHIRAWVAAEGQQYPDMHWEQGYRPGERRTCITLNGTGDEFLEQISLTDVHVIYEGGGTAEEAALRDVPQIAGEYFEMGPRPAYGLFARNVRGLTLQNVRVEFAKPDLRPAVVFDHVSDATVNGLVAQGNGDAESVLRLIASKDVLVSAARVMGEAKAFLRVEGSESAGIVVDGGAIANAGKPVEAAAGASAGAVRVRG